MTAASHERSLPQPQSKAPPTVQSSHPAIVANNVRSYSPAPARTAKITKTRQDAPVVDQTSKPAILSMIRRTLAPGASQNLDPRSTSQSLADILPPLTSFDEADLQLELYAIIAIVVKEFVNTWYSKITPDHAFTDEVVNIIAHCSLAIEQRIRRIDVAELVLDEIPALVENHVNAYRTAISSSAGRAYAGHSRAIYHSLNPHPALSPLSESQDGQVTPEQVQNEAIYRQLLVSGALAVLLPPGDLQNAPLRILVGDIIADLIVGQVVAERVCEGWFLHEAINKTVAVSKQRIEPRASGQELRHGTKTRLEQFGLLTPKDDGKTSQSHERQSQLTVWFWRTMQWVYLIVVFGWSTVQGLLQARHFPTRHRSINMIASLPHIDECDLSPRPVLAYAISSLISTSIRLSERMPWLSGAILFWRHVLLFGSGRLAASNSVFDRFLYHQLDTYVFTPGVVMSVLSNLRVAIFPNNSLGPPAPAPPSPEEQVQIRRRAARAILDSIPPVLAGRFFASDEEEAMLSQIEGDVLDAFGDKYMNKHLVYEILELVLVRLIPELRDTGVGELLAERGVDTGEEEAGSEGQEGERIPKGKTRPELSLGSNDEVI